MVFSGFVTACRFATWPTNRLPSLANATTDGVVRPPSEFVITVGSPPSITATTELVVPKSIPIILLIAIFFSNKLLASQPKNTAPRETQFRYSNPSYSHSHVRVIRYNARLHA